MELTDSFLTLLYNFHSVFTPPTYQTFVDLVTGWILSRPPTLRDRSQLLHWPCRAGPLVSLSSLLQSCRLVHRLLLHAPDQAGRADSPPRAHSHWAVDDTLCRKRGLTLFGAGMHYDPLISSQVLGQLGTRLGRRVSDRRQTLLGTDQGLRLTNRHAPVPQPPRADQGEKELEGNKRAEEFQQTQARSESSHPT